MKNISNKTAHVDKYKKINYLESPLISSYFNSKEKRAYYLSIKHADSRRDYHSEIIKTFNSFLYLVDDISNVEILDIYIFNDDKNNLSYQLNSNFSRKLEVIHPEGFKLLRLEPSLTLESLKESYRTAAMKHHPDRGGKHVDMLIVNEAYKIYHDYLCKSYNSKNEINSNFFAEPKSASDYIYLTVSLLSLVYCDEWDILNAYQSIKKLREKQFYRSRLVETGDEIYKLVEMASTLTKRLSTAKLHSEANDIMEFAKYIYNLGKLDYSPYIEEAENILQGGEKLKIILNHPRQAENALSNGIIPKKRYTSLLKKFEKNHENKIKSEETIIKLLTSINFVELPYDCGINRECLSKTKDIPEIGYFEDKKVHHLSKDQQAEYFLAFSNLKSINLLRKYTYTRLSSYVLSIDNETDKQLIDRIVDECRFLFRIFDTPLRKDKNTKDLIEIFCTVIECIGNLPISKRSQKIDEMTDKFSYLLSDFDPIKTMTI